MRESQKENSISYTKITQMNECFKRVGTFYDEIGEIYAKIEALLCVKRVN
ncbi:MAG: hypothetical protein LR001_01470 [Clostridiales bacterium]|nr:hypothetical protein [Clostridiales bacterium]